MSEEERHEPGEGCMTALAIALIVVLVGVWSIVSFLKRYFCNGG